MEWTDFLSRKAAQSMELRFHSEDSLKTNGSNLIFFRNKGKSATDRLRGERRSLV